MRIKAWLIAACLLANLFTGCASSDKSLYAHGLDVIALMQEMTANESYLTLYSGNEEVQEHLSAIGEGDHTTPQAVYRIRVVDGAFPGLLVAEQMEGLSDTLKAQVESKMLASLLTQINAMKGSTALAAASILIAEKTFVSDQLTENIVYLYTYADAVPAAVIFLQGEDGAVSASGMFILEETLPTDTAQEIEAFFAEYAVEAEVEALPQPE